MRNEAGVRISRAITPFVCKDRGCCTQAVTFLVLKLLTGRSELLLLGSKSSCQVKVNSVFDHINTNGELVSRFRL